MNYKMAKLLYTSLTLALLFALFPIFPIGTAQAKPKIYVEPKNNIFYTDTTSVGSQFTVNVMAADFAAPGVFSYEFKLYYAKTMLEAVSGEIPTGHWLTPTLKPGNIFIVDGGTVNTDAGYVSFAATLLAPEEGKTGSGTIAKVTLKITAAPATGKLSCLLELKDVLLVDPTAAEIPKANYDIIHGYYEFAAPPPKLYLKLEPSLVTATAVGDEVRLTAMINDVEANLKVVAVEFKVTFDSSVLSTTSLNAIEGEFFKGFGDTFFVAYASANYIVVGVLLLPTATGVYPPTAKGFPTGSGSLATIKFTAINMPQTVTDFPIRITDVIILDSSLNLIPPKSLIGATLKAPTRPEDINQDGIVNMVDMTIFAVAFGSYPGHLRWNPKADIDKNDKVNILDGVKIAKAFGK